MYEPDPEVAAGSRVPDWQALEREATEDLLGFWGREAFELAWSKPWDAVLDDTDAPFYRWFPGAETNIVTNCVDRHLLGPRKNKLALIWVGEDTEEPRGHVAEHLSPIAKPDHIAFVDALPKTRSGKTMRRALRARALGQDEGDLSTLVED